MNTEEKIDLFERTPVPQAIKKLAFPSVISSLVMVIYNLTDTFFVGMINDPVQNAAITLAAPVLLAFNAVNNLFGIGTASMMSRAMGRKDYDTVQKSSVFGFYGTLFCGILFSLLCTVLHGPLLAALGADAVTGETTTQYMLWTVTCGAAPAILNVVMAHMVRAEGASLHASIGTMSGCLLNMVLDPIFILWLGMGASGAGLATFLSNCVACAYFFVLLRLKRGSTFVCIDPKKFTLNKQIVGGICNVGIPASIQNLLNVTGMTILNNFTAPYGATAVSAMGIAHRIALVPLNVSLGFTQGVMPLVGYSYANGNYKRMKESVLFAIKLMVPLTACVALCFLVGARPIVTAFLDVPEVVAYGSTFLREQAIGLPLMFIDFMTVSVFQSIGMGGRAFLFAITRKILLEIPALFVLNALFPLYGLAFALSFSEIILGTVAIFMLRKIFKDCTKSPEKQLMPS